MEGSYESGPEPEPEPGPDNTERIFIPPDFYCPISGDLISNPVSDPFGHTYEKKCIIQWLKVKRTSPLTNQYLDIYQLEDNIAMKRIIESIKSKIQLDQQKTKPRVTELKLKPYRSTLRSTQIRQFYNDGKLLVSIDVPYINTRPPIDLVLCIDVSYSMSEEATLKDSKNEKVEYGISVLSLTISAAKTILYSLNEDDNISIVTYSTESKIVVKNIPCSPENKQNISMELDNLKPISNTNMWQGINTSLDILRELSPPSKNKGVILLTDGVPNVIPPRGHETMLKRYFDQYNFRCPISCYGFGYNLDSELLLNLSEISGGDGFSFIPDASILGSVFINGISNLLTTAIYNPSLKINLKKGLIFKDSGKHSIDINISSLKYGRTKNIIFDIDTSGCVSLDAEYLRGFSDTSLTLYDSEIKSNGVEFLYDNILRQIIRIEAVEIINKSILHKKFNNDRFKGEIESFILKIQDLLEQNGNEYIQNIQQDFIGQIKEALNLTSRGDREDWFSQWGIHYLRSLQDAYRNEICNNFKDKGILNFKGKIFNKCCDEISTIFEAIPPPKPDIIKNPSIRRTGTSTRTQQSNRPVLRNMSEFNNPGGGCCIGSSKIHTIDGLIEASNIKKGDRVISYDTVVNDYTETIIDCVIKTKCYAGEELLTKITSTLGTIITTPYHPIFKLNDKWYFPINHPNTVITKNIKCDYIYTFVTQNRKSIIVDGYIYATLGHNINGKCIYHNYFGSDKVIADLKLFNDFSKGCITLTKDMFHRKGGLVYKITSK